MPVLDWQVILESLPLYGEGLVMTLKLTILALATGFIGAVFLALCRTSGIAALNAPAFLFTYVFRGTPLLVQIYLFYYGLGQFKFIQESWAWVYLREAFPNALLALSLNTAAYTAELLRGAIVNIPKGQIEAAKAYGMGPWLIVRRIKLGIALRTFLPAYGNEVIFLLHGTSLCSLITLVDLTGAGKIVASRHYTPIEAYLTSGAAYLFITLLFVAFFRWVESKRLAYLTDSR